MINSHIVLPKFLLKNFEIGHSFWYYDIDGRFIAKGNAASFNTEKGYYSDETEQVLNYAVETPFSKLLKSYIEPILYADAFEMSRDDIQLIKRFFYSLISRNPRMVEQVNNSSIFYQFLPKKDQHGYAAVAGTVTGVEQDIFKDYEVVFFVNQTEAPFVLPNCGIYDFVLMGVQYLALPISPNILFALAKIIDAENNPHELHNRLLLIEETLVKQMNLRAIGRQIKMNAGGRVICSQKEELERLQAENFLQRG